MKEVNTSGTDYKVIRQIDRLAGRGVIEAVYNNHSPILFHKSPLFPFILFQNIPLIFPLVFPKRDSNEGKQRNGRYSSKYSRILYYPCSIISSPTFTLHFVLLKEDYFKQLYSKVLRQEQANTKLLLFTRKLQLLYDK